MNWRDDKLDAEVEALMAIRPERFTSRQNARLCAVMRELAELIERRKRRRTMRKKKKRKKKLPRSGCTRRRLRQCFAGCDAPRDVFPLVVDWLLIDGGEAGMDLQVGVFVVVKAVAYAWLVLLISLLALCFILSSSGLDALHHVRYGREEQLRGTSLS